MFENLTIGFGAYLTLVLALGILAQWLAWRFKLPSILLLLGFGFISGQLLGVNIDQFLPADESHSMLLSVVGLCVAVILFEGGLTLKFSELRESGAPVLRLCTLGVIVSFVMTTAVGIYFFQWNWRVATILGSILVVTGPTVIAPLLRHIKPSKKMSSIVKWEGIVVDPIGAIMAVLCFQVSLAGDVEEAKMIILKSLGLTILVGVVMAFVLAKVIEELMKKHLIPDFLHAVFLLAAVAVAFSVSNSIQKESGLLTVTVMGIALVNQKSVSVKHILEFKEILRTLIISLLFIILSGRIDLDSFEHALLPGIVLTIVLIVVIRPASIFISNLFSKRTTFKERVFLSALAPRGIVAAAVTSIFALELSHAAKHVKGFPEEIGEQVALMVPVVFIVIIGTVAFYGLLAAPFAQRLGLASKNPRGILFAGAAPWVRALAKELQNDGHQVLLLDTNFSNISAANMEGLPARRANILSEYVEEELDFSGLGQLIACTHNDEVNSLATHEFSHIFGSENVWQIAPEDDKQHHTTAVAAHMRGRIIFPGRPNHDELSERHEKGFVIKCTNISEQFPFDKFKEEHPNAVVLFVDTPDKGLVPAEDKMKNPGEGSKVYSVS